MSILRSFIQQHEKGKVAFLQGETLFHTGDLVQRMHLVLSGEVVLERFSLSGVRLVLQRARAGDIIAEPSVFAENYHCDAVAISLATVKIAPVEAIRIALLQDSTGMERLARDFAREVQITRFRAEMLSIRRLSDRLDVWLDLNGGLMPDKGSWLILAADLAVTPEALYRELAKRRNTSQASRGASALRAW